MKTNNSTKVESPKKLEDKKPAKYAKGDPLKVPLGELSEQLKKLKLLID